MRAVVLDEDRTLALRDVPDPEPSDGQTLVHVRAAGVNYADVLVREGRYPQPPPLPYVPGSEIAGETDDGRRVLAFVRIEGGGFAERAAAEDEWLFDLPEAASYEEGAAFLLAFLTAWIPLTRQVHVRPGSRVLVTAAAGGITYYLQKYSPVFKATAAVLVESPVPRAPANLPVPPVTVTTSRSPCGIRIRPRARRVPPGS